MARVLVVDDSKIIRQIIREELEKDGHTIVGEAESGSEAIMLYKKQKPDLVTLDITMDDMDGIEAVTRIFQMDKKAKIIIVSALQQKSVIEELKKLGVADYLVKPFLLEELSAQVKKIL